MPSARKRAKDQLLPIYRETIFIDRSLGASIVPDALRGAGLRIVTMREHYGEEAGARTADVDWIAEVGNLGWINQGQNTLTVEIVGIPGQVGTPPWVLLTSAVVYYQ